MGTTLHSLSPNKGSTKTKKRLGRGRGSGTGKTSGKGVKGQKARPGHHGARIGFEGGQMPMKMRIAKRGFKNPFRVEAYPINLRTLEDLFETGATVDVDALRARGLVPKKAEAIKILAEGDLTKKLTVKAHRFSAAAKDKIEKAGGSAVPLEAAAAA
ncbi:MAG TPA: 50S ribosomal protein L15 [Kofleriaceae bacterium]|nr:50S ribosomal protein L15 [Kofleriaceae bacterium]